MAQFIGIDLHKNTSHVVVFDDQRNEFVLNKNIRTRAERFEDELGALPPAKVLVEASTPSTWVAQCLEALGHEVIIGDPNYEVMYASRPANCKNDEKDAKALAFALRHGHYRPVHRKSAANRDIEMLLGTRASLVASRTMHINRIKALYLGLGVSVPKADAASLRARILAAGVPDRCVDSVKPLLEMLAMLDDQLRSCDRRLEAIANNLPLARRLMTLPGVGVVVALAFIAAVDLVGRFPSAHKLESYFGLVPKISASAWAGKGGRISKAGTEYVRALMVQAAWSLVRSTDPKATPLREWTLAVAQRRTMTIAITGLARRMVGVLYAMWRDEKDFELRESTHRPHDASKAVKKYQLRRSGRRA